MRGYILSLALAVAAGLASAANAEVIAERLPAGDPGFVATWSNQADGQNFLTQIVLGSDATAGSMTIWTVDYLSGVQVGGSTTLRIRVDAAGSPADTNLYEIIAPIADISPSAYPGIVGVTVYFSPISLSAGTYWIGLSGTGDSELGWTTFDTGTSGFDYQRQLFGEDVYFTPGIFTLAYSLGGAGTSVPEPATWAMMLLGLGGMGVALRRRSREPAHA